MADNKVFDIADIVLKKGISVQEALKYVYPGDQISMGSPADYFNKYSKDTNKDNPNAKDPKVIGDILKQVTEVKSLYDRGAYIEQRHDPMTAYTSRHFGFTPPMEVLPAPVSSDNPFLIEFDAEKPQRIMSDNMFAYKSNTYAVPDGKGGYKMKNKEPGWDLDGKLVFVPNPDTNGTTKMVMKLDEGDNTAGVEQLRTTFGMPDDYNRNALGQSVKNMLSAIPRFMEGAGDIFRSAEQGATYTAEADKFFEDTNGEKFLQYRQRLEKNIHTAADKKIFDEAYASNDKTKLKEMFQYMEHKDDTPVWERNTLKSMRMTDYWNERDRAYNAFTDAMDNMQNMTPERYKQMNLKDVGNVMYNASAVIADLAIQIGAGLATGGSVWTAGAVGAFQAVGTNMRAMRDAGFDEATIGKTLLWQLPAIAVTEALVGKLWMFKALPKNVVDDVFQEMGEHAQKAFRASKGKLSSGEAMKFANESTKKLWQNGNFRKFIDGNPYVQTALKAIPAEILQENTEDGYYAWTNLINELQRPEYYKDQITTGANTEDIMFSKGGIFDPEQMLNTTVLTAIATGGVNIATMGAQGALKPENIKKRQDLLRSSWVSEQAANGNLPLFIKRAQEEYQKPVNAFGSKQDLLENFGAEPIIIPTEAAKPLAPYFKTETDGSIVIDNIADANYLNFIQTTTAIQEVVEKHGLDGKTVNAKMLHQVYNMNNMLLSTVAIDNAVAMDNAQAGIEALQQEMGTDASTHTPEQLEQLKELNDSFVQAKSTFDYLTKIEEGTSFSKGVNDEMKQMLTTYDVANQEAKKMLGDKFNPEDQKTFDLVKNLWSIHADANLSYKKFNALLDTFRTIKEGDKNAIQDKIDNVGKADIKAVESTMSEMAESLKKHAGLGDVDFANKFADMDESFKNLSKTIDDLLKVNMVGVGKYNDLVSKHKAMYKIALDRLTGIESKLGEEGAYVEEMRSSSDAFEQSLAVALEADSPVDVTQLPGYDEYAKKKLKTPAKLKKFNAQVKSIQDHVALDLPEVDPTTMLEDSNISDEAYAGMTADRKAALEKELAELPSLAQYMTNHIDAMAKMFDEAATMFEGNNIQKDPKNLMRKLDSFQRDRELLKISNEVATRLAGNETFENHANKDEQDVINDLASDAINKSNQEKLQKMKSDYDKFMKASGMDAMTSIKGQHHSRAINLSNISDTVIYLNGLKLNGITTPLITDAQMSQMRVFKMDETMYTKKGDYSEEELRQLEDMEKAVMEVMNNIQSKRAVVFTDANMDIILQPVRTLMLKGMDPLKLRMINRYANIVGFDGSFKVGTEPMSDINALRFISHSGTFDEHAQTISNKETGQTYFAEKLIAYTNTLMVMDNDIAPSEFLGQRLRLTTPYVSTYEQEMGENTLGAFLNGSPLLSKIHSFEDRVFKDMQKDNKEMKIVEPIVANSVLLLGNYGVGKTEQMVPMVYRIMKLLDKMPAKTTVFAPSPNLMNTHKKSFAEFGDKISYAITSTITSTRTFTEKEVWIIDEASLLSIPEIETLETISKNSGGLLRIVFMGDMNQMQAKDNTLGYPAIMGYSFKLPMLSEQFSSLSPMLQEFGVYWNQMLSRNRQMPTMVKMENMPKGYHEQNSTGMKKGSHYYSSTDEVWSSFLGQTKNDDKAIIFYDEDQYNAFMEGKDKALFTENADKIFFINTNIESKRIQGLRRSEVYIAFNYFTQTDKPKDVFTAIYTAVGRGSSFVGMNIGTQAKDFNVTEQRLAENIGDVTADNKAYQVKIEEMKKYQKTRLERVMKDMGYIGRPGTFVAPINKNGEKTSFEKPKKLPVVTKDGTAIPFTLRASNDTYYDVIAHKETVTDKDGRVSYWFELDKKQLGVGRMFLSSSIDDTDLELIIMDLLDEHVQGNPISAKTLNLNMKSAPKAPEKKVTAATDKSQPKPRKAKKVTDDSMPAEPATKNKFDDPFTEPSPAVPNYNADEKLSMHKSQALNWASDRTIYGTPYFVKTDKKLSAHDMKIHRAMHSFIINDFSNTEDLHLVFHSQLNAVDATNEVQTYQDVLVVRYIPSKIITASDLRKRSKEATGTIKSELERLSKMPDDKLNKELEKYYDVATIALPLKNPAFNDFKGEQIPNAVENYEDMINYGYNRAIEAIKENKKLKQDEKDEQMEIITQSREAQISIARLRYAGSQSVLVDGKADLGSIKKIKSSLIKIVYGQDLHPVADMDIDFDNVTFPLQPITTLNESGQLYMMGLYYEQNGESMNRFKFTVQMPKINNAIVGERVSQESNTDEQLLDIATTDKPVTKNKEPYAKMLQALNQTFMFQIIMGNRANMHKLQSEGKIRFNDYITFVKDGKDIMPVGENQEEMVKNLQELKKLIYGEWASQLYMPFKRSWDADGKLSINIDKTIMQTRATRINVPHYFFELPDGPSIERTSTEEPETSSERPSRPAPFMQKQNADEWDTTTRKQSKQVKAITDMLGGAYTKNIVLHNEMINHNNVMASGMMLDGRIHMTSINGQVRSSTPYHEALHYVWNYLIDQDAKQKYELLAKAEAKKQTGEDLSGIDLEEWIASDFSKSSVGVTKNIWTRFKNWLKDLVNHVHKNRSELEGFYSDIRNGKFADRLELENNSNEPIIRFQNDTTEEEPNAVMSEEDYIESLQIADRESRFNDLKKQLPTDSMALDTFSNMVRYYVNKYSPLGSSMHYDPTIVKSVEDSINEAVKQEKAYGDLQMMVNRNGVEEIVSVRSLTPEDYENIYSVGTETDMVVRKNKGKAIFKNWYFNTPENFAIVLEHALPTFNAKTRTLKRGSVVGNSYDWRNMDPSSDGFTAIMKMQLETVPSISIRSGKVIIDSRNPRFVDFKRLNELVKQVGIDASKIYDNHKSEKDYSMMDAFMAALTKTISNTGTQVDIHGDYLNNSTAMLVAFKVKFLQGEFKDLSDTSNETQRSMYDVALSLRQKHMKGKVLSDNDKSRADVIENFLAALMNVSNAYVLNNNGKITVTGNNDYGFSYSFTEYGSNIFDSKRNQMKDLLDQKLNGGAFTGAKRIQQFNTDMHVDDATGTVYYGREDKVKKRNIAFVERVKEEGMSYARYHFASDNTNQIMQWINGSARTLGLTSNIVPKHVLRKIVEARTPESWDTLPLLKEGLAKDARGKMAYEVYSSPSEWLAAYIANSAYAYQSQLKNFIFRFTYLDEKGDKRSYSKDENINEHMQAISRLLPMVEDNKPKMVVTSVNGQEMNGELSDVMEALGFNVFNPTAEYVRDFMDATGTSTTLNKDESVFAYNNMFFGIPSQFYTSINGLASIATSEMGQATGATVFRPDGKRQYALQMRNKYNEVIGGMARRIDTANKRLEVMTPEEKALLPIMSTSGEVLLPYLRKDDGLVLDHIIDAFGIDRNYGLFKHGVTEYTTLDYMASSVFTFINKIMSTNMNNQFIVTPTSTISDTGRMYLLVHKMMDKPLVVSDGNKIRTQWHTAYNQVALRAELIQRMVDMSFDKYVNMISTMNKLFKAEGFAVPVPTKKSSRSQGLSREAFIATSDKMVMESMRAMSEENRRKVMDYVRGTDLDKTMDMRTTKEDGTNIESFVIGHVASDKIRNLTDHSGIYTPDVRSELIKNRKGNLSEKDKETFIKKMFSDDFRASMKYMKDMGFTDNNGFMKEVNEKAMNESPMTDLYHSTDPMKVNEAMFAFYMSFHIANNAFEDTMGTVVGFKDIYDKVKRFGAYSTPKTPLQTNMMIGNWFVGSLPDTSPAIPIEDLSLDVDLMGTSVHMDKATDGETPVFDMWYRMFEKSAGGKEFSISGDTAMAKTLGIKHDMLTQQTYMLKHAQLRITGTMVRNNEAYFHMHMTALRFMDNLLAKDAAYQELIKGNYALKNYRFEDVFLKEYHRTDDFETTMEKMYKDMIDMQTMVNGQDIYQRVVRSVPFGFPTKNTRKIGVRQINDYDPRPESEHIPDVLAYEMMDNTELGVILNSDQPADASKPQSQANQQNAFIGIGPFQLQGPVADKYGKNPGIAVSLLQQEIYDLRKNRMIEEISRTVPGVPMEPLLSFDKIDWRNPNVIADYGDNLDYAIAQFEWYVRRNARKGLMRSKVPGNFSEMLASRDVTAQIPQMRIRMVNFIRNEINMTAIKPGVTGMRSTQASGMLHEMYVLKGESMPFTLDDALFYIYGDMMPRGANRFSQMTQKKLAETFTKRGLLDMRVDKESGETMHGEIVMPFIFAGELGLRRKGMGQRRDETLRDVFTITNGMGLRLFLKDMTDTEFDKAFSGIQLEDMNDQFFDNVLIRKAVQNILNDQPKADRMTAMEFQAELRAGTDPFMYRQLVTETRELMVSVNESLMTYANRVPSNRLGSGAILDVVGIHYDGNESFIPLGMALINDSDFDIDQLALYVKRMAEKGLITIDEMNEYERYLLDIYEQVYMAKDNQQNIFIESSIKDIQAIGDKNKKDGKMIEQPLADNTLYSAYKTYNDNKAGADAIGIVANTLSTVSWLQTIAPMTRLGGTNDHIRRIIANKDITGLRSTVVRVGNWLQVALDNNKYNTLGKYGVTPEAVPLISAMVAIGPQEGMTEDSFLEYIKEFFTNSDVQKVLHLASLGSSIHFKKNEYDLYTLIVEALEKHTRQRKTDVSTTNDQAKKELADFMPGFIDYVNSQMIEEATKMTEFDEEVMKNTLSRKADNITKAIVDDPMRTRYYELRDAERNSFNQERNELAIARLSELRQLVITAESLRGFSNVITLRNGIPAVDWDFYNATESIQLSLGMSMQNFMKVRNTDDFMSEDNVNAFTEYFKEHDSKYARAKTPMQRDMLVQKAVEVYKSFNLKGAIRAVPMFKVYLTEMVEQKNILGSTFITDNPVVQSIGEQFMKACGLNRWEYRNQMSDFNNAISELALDDYFKNNFKDRRFFIGMPIGNVYDNRSVYNNLDMTNVYHRQMLSLEMSNFIEGLQSEFTSQQAVEEYFEAFFPNGDNQYEGMYKALYDENGIRQPNAFIDNLLQLGTGDRHFVGLNIQSNMLTEDMRRRLQNDFNRLPQGIQDLFIINEIISNKLNYRAGSISDVIGLRAYREGLSESFDNLNASIRRGDHRLLIEQPMMDKFMDYMAVVSDTPPSVSANNISDRQNPKYVRAKLVLKNRDSNIMTTYKRDGIDVLPMNLIPNRAGWSMDQRIITSTGVISPSSEELDTLAKTDRIVKYYAKGHSYESGPFFLDNGVGVRVAASPDGMALTIAMPEGDYMKEAIEFHNKSLIAKIGRRVIISRNEGEMGMMVAEQGKEDLHDAVSIFGSRPFILPMGIIEGQSRDMTFQTLHEAIIGIKHMYYTMFMKEVKNSKVTFNEKQTQNRRHMFSKANKEMDIKLEKHPDIANKIRNNLGRVTPYIIARSYVGHTLKADMLRDQIVRQRKTTNEDGVLKKWMNTNSTYSEMLYNFDTEESNPTEPIKIVLLRGEKTVAENPMDAAATRRLLDTKEELRVIDNMNIMKEMGYTGYTGQSDMIEMEKQGKKKKKKCGN